MNDEPIERRSCSAVALGAINLVKPLFEAIHFVEFWVLSQKTIDILSLKVLEAVAVSL